MKSLKKYFNKYFNKRLKPVKRFVTHAWYQPDIKAPLSLRFLSLFYWLASKNRHRSFLKKQYECFQAPVPLIVVGNITAGGTGKTPVVIALAKYLQSQQYNVGIISRGYGGNSRRWPVEVNKHSDASLVGDEPVLITQHAEVPMFVGPDRQVDIEVLLKHYPDIDVIITDDGLQHYKLVRDIEIAVIDGERLMGNKKMMPAGPLREPMSRLKMVDLCVVNGGAKNAVMAEHHLNHVFDMKLKTTEVYALNDRNIVRSLSEFSGKDMHAIAGIGNPQRFFNVLKTAGINIISHEFDDHHQFKTEDLVFGKKIENVAAEELTSKNLNKKKKQAPIQIKSGNVPIISDNLPIIMTEKDAVKCAALGLENCWVVAVEAEIEHEFFEQTHNMLLDAINKHQIAYC